MNVKSIILAFLFSTTAYAEQKFEAEAQVTQDKGTQLSGTLRWLLPKSEKTVFQWGAHFSGGVTENSDVTSTDTLRSADYLFAGGGLSFVGTTSIEAVSAFSEFTLGIDGINLETSDGKEAKHLLFKVHTGLRLSSSSRAYYSAGISFFNRRLTEDKQVRVNDQLLTKYSLSPMIGFGVSL